MEIEKETAYWCKTKKIATTFLKKCEEQNIKWIDYQNATSNNYYNLCSQNLGYIRLGDNIVYCDIIYAIRRGLKIIRLSNNFNALKISQKQITKAIDFDNTKADISKDTKHNIDINSAEVIFNVIDGFMVT